MPVKLIDGSDRIITTLRISITNKCNLNCIYCKRDKFDYGFQNSFLSCEEIESLINLFVKVGIDKIKITGGEPLLRSDIENIISKIRKNHRIKDISLTTNGIFLKNQALNLKKAGLKRINISLDSLKRHIYREITGIDSFYDVIEGIEIASGLGFSPIKINVVIMRGINSDEIINFLVWAEEKKLIIRFIEYMPVYGNKDEWLMYFVPSSEIFSQISKIWKIEKMNIEFPSPGPAKYYRIKGNKIPFGIISGVSQPYCSDCNRIRIDSSGNLFLCLYDRISFNLKDFLKTKSEIEFLAFINTLILRKKGSCNPCFSLTDAYLPHMCTIGG